MPKITKISRQKNNSKIFNVFIDNKFLTGIDDIAWIKYGFKIGDQITTQTINKLKHQGQANKAYDMALKLLSYRPQSILEIKQKMLKKFNLELIDKTISRLIKQELLNDKRFAISWIKERSITRLRSRRHLISELRRKGIPQNIITQALQSILSDNDEIETAMVLIKKKLGQLEQQKIPDKVKAYLARRGFSYKTILEAEKRLKINA